MGMGIVSDNDFLKESSVLIPKEKTVPSQSPVTIIDSPAKGRGNNPEVPNALRNVIGDEAATNGRQSAVALAEKFGISPSSASAYANGSTSTATYSERPNVGVIAKSKARIHKIARGRLMSALSKITDDKLDGTTAKDLAGIAKDMSAVVKHMEPEKESGSAMNNNGPTFVFYAPRIAQDESRFETILAKD